MTPPPHAILLCHFRDAKKLREGVKLNFREDSIRFYLYLFIFHDYYFHWSKRKQFVHIHSLSTCKAIDIKRRILSNNSCESYGHVHTSILLFFHPPQQKKRIFQSFSAISHASIFSTLTHSLLERGGKTCSLHYIQPRT